MARPARPSPRPYDGAGGFSRMVREVDPHLVDLLIALVLTAAGVAIVIGRPSTSDFREDDFLGAALVVGQTLPLALRRTAPLGVLIGINAALFAHSAIGYDVVQAGTLGSLLATYGAASLTDNRRTVIAAAVTVAGVAGFYATNRADYGVWNFAATGATWVLALAAGTFVRLRGEQVEVAGARATRLELERDMRAREAVADERARMARELHDIVGHALNVIVIQAAGARRVFDTQPQVSRDALASIESTGREALSEMERMLGVLRASDADEETPGPQPGLSQLDSLAAHVSEAGIPVDVVVEGASRAIPASVELSAYRIVQESLTNCLKHSGATQATVTVRYQPDHLEVEVVDNGRGPAAQTEGVNTGGRGHVGMRERAGLFGGEIAMGSVSAAGGYRVRARLPFTSAPQ